MNRAIQQFIQNNITADMVKDKDVIEIGCRNVNGTVRPYIESLGPKTYIATDMVSGRGVDVVCDVYDIFNRYTAGQFDLVISTEMMEHVENWRLAITNIKLLCKIGGYVVITTRSKGFRKHGYPLDFWRFEVDDIKKIFESEEYIVEKDFYAPGVFVIAKRLDGELVDLDNIKLFNINSLTIE